jgi:hypothetical protein
MIKFNVIQLMLFKISILKYTDIFMELWHKKLMKKLVYINYRYNLLINC